MTKGNRIEFTKYFSAFIKEKRYTYKVEYCTNEPKTTSARSVVVGGVGGENRTASVRFGQNHRLQRDAELRKHVRNALPLRHIQADRTATARR